MHSTQTHQFNDTVSGRCCWRDCEEFGKFPAPKPSMKPNDRYYFCLAHIREYNKSWDFFKGMGADQIDKFQQDSILGHRPTWKFGMRAAYNSDDIKKQVFRQFKSGDRNDSASEKNFNIPKKIRDALKILGLAYPVSIEEIKSKYKLLAKEHHPDLNKNGSDERIKSINEAYSLLKNSDIFKE